MSRFASFSARRRVLAALVVTTLGCSRGPKVPRQLTFEGARLTQAATRSKGGISSVVFIRPGETLPTASVEVGVLVSREHASGAALSQWLLAQYRSSPTNRWYEATTADEACKVGIPAIPPPRPFLALHICRGLKGVAACAEIDERLDEAVMSRCLNRGSDCWDEMCAQRWSSRRATLEALLKDVENSR